MTILACVPAPDWAVLGTTGTVIAAKDLPLALVTSGVERLLDPTTRVSAGVREICAAALEQLPRERDWTVLGFAQVFARAYGPLVEGTLHVLVAGIGPAENLAAIFSVVLEAGKPPAVERVFEPSVRVDGVERGEGLASFAPLRATIDSAVTVRKNPPARKVARLVRRLLVEASGPSDVDVVIVSRAGLTRVDE